ncbi:MULTISPECIES: spinster family MFS transporter [unclassified Novosphingobium]|uniref:spinster family MFS transporter n=1 Tax=Novosphingobium TaxID=165696 RepID=UPI00146B8C42|nr:MULTISPECIES: MFS transporter [unclassified Novosphingobium]NMN04747.1 MFS family permease [Novosphingobium sp. SG919]NMN85259.1 MFS family permease [Novosphingobium sp. SG916]
MRNDEDERLLSPRYGRTFIAMSFLVATFNFADRSVFAVTAQAIKSDLALSDFQLGILQGLSFAVLYALLGVPIGRLAERRSRLGIITAAILFWSGMTMACAAAGSFVQMMLCRIGVGMGEAGSQPATSSLVGDLFPRQRRASVMGLILLGSPIGTFVGASVGGAVAGMWGWRTAFVVMGLPGLLIGLLVVLLLREPRRGLADGLAATPRPAPDFRAFLKVVGRKPALVYVIAGGALAGFGMSSISQFLAVFLSRAYDLPARTAGTLYGTISALALGSGLLIGSFGTDWLARRGDGRWPAWGAAIGLLIAPFSYWIALNAASPITGTVLLIVSGCFLLLYYGPTTGMIQNLLEPRMRATGAAVFGMFYTLVGYGGGPTFVGWMSDWFATRAYGAADYLARCPAARPGMGALDAAHQACAAASASGLRSALMASVCVFFIAAVMFLLAARTLRQDYFVAEPAA